MNFVPVEDTDRRRMLEECGRRALFRARGSMRVVLFLDPRPPIDVVPAPDAPAQFEPIKAHEAERVRFWSLQDPDVYMVARFRDAETEDEFYVSNSGRYYALAQD